MPYDHLETNTKTQAVHTLIKKLNVDASNEELSNGISTL